MIKNRLIHAVCWGILVAAVLMILVDGPAFAQGMGGMGGGGMGGMGGQKKGNKRKSRKNSKPSLGPELNLLPETATTFEGQFLMRQLPQQAAIDQFARNAKSLDRLQTEITETENQVKSGVKGSGHAVHFMNYGGYYSFPRGGGQ